MLAIVFMIMLTRFSERIFNPMRYTGITRTISILSSAYHIVAEINIYLFMMFCGVNKLSLKTRYIGKD